LTEVATFDRNPGKSRDLQTPHLETWNLVPSQICHLFAVIH
jgi:hypothetical protein